MPEIVLAKGKKRHKLLGLIAAVVLIVAVAGCSVAGIGAVVAAKKHDDTMAKADQFDKQQGYSAEKQILITYVASQPPKQYRRDALDRLGEMALRDNHYSEAAVWYTQAYDLTDQHNLDEVVGLAQASAGMGDKSSAVSYYQEAINLVPAQPKRDHDAQVTQYKNALMAAEALP